jgi:NAD(P)H-binding
LLKNGKHNITVVTRRDSTRIIDSGAAEVVKVDYNDEKSLIESFKGHDCLIITLSGMVPPDLHNKIVDAAVKAGVSWILPNEWGNDGSNPDVNKDVHFGDWGNALKRKVADREHITTLGVPWLAVACGFWYEYSLAGGTDQFGFDFKNKEVVFYDDGTRRINTSTWEQTGLATANLLALKILPDDEHDKSPCLSQCKGKYIHISSFNINQREMFESVLRVTGDSPNDWKQISIPVKQVYQNGMDELNKGNNSGFAKIFYSRMFFPDNAGNAEMLYGLQNEILNVPKESLDEATRRAIWMAEEG